jgi:hypothetical protein
MNLCIFSRFQVIQCNLVSAIHEVFHGDGFPQCELVTLFDVRGEFGGFLIGYGSEIVLRMVTDAGRQPMQATSPMIVTPAGVAPKNREPSKRTRHNSSRVKAVLENGRVDIS